MSINHPPSVKGRNIGIALLFAIQLIIGIIHVVFGAWLLVASNNFSSIAFGLGYIYNLYTLVYGLLTSVFAFGLWFGKNWGWYGTLAVGFFVIVADSLTILNLPSIPGIPKIAGFGEIPYSILVVAYLLQSHIRTRYVR
jgi:hypothetical protein